jgi:HAD superfamily hydrolase (TIGR01544 family)
MSAADGATGAPRTPHDIAEAAHSDVVNALTTPTPTFRHHTAPVPVSVVYSSPGAYAAKRARLISGGRSSLVLVADFDRTLSAFRCANGDLCHASHQLLEDSVRRGQEHEEQYAAFKAQIDAINSRYFALEICHELTEEVRRAHMFDWWHTAHALLLEQHIEHRWMEVAVTRARASGSLELRRGTKELLHSMNAAEVPCVVFSAGLKETIAITLRQEEAILPNMHLIGNEMVFSPEGLLTAFGADTITSSNKNYTHVILAHPAFHAASRARRHVILLGDNLGDATMSDGLEHVDTILKIGLLHDNVEARLDKFKAAFDVVLLGDPSMEFLQELVDAVLASNPLIPC